MSTLASLHSLFAAKEIQLFRDVLQAGDVYIVTGLKIARGLKYTKQRTSGHDASIRVGGHVTQDVAVEDNLGGSSSGEQTDSWTVLGDPILACRLHVIEQKRALFGEWKVSVESYVPKAGFRSEKEELDTFEGEAVGVLPDYVGHFSEEQEVQVKYVELQDEEEWTLAVLET